MSKAFRDLRLLIPQPWRRALVNAFHHRYTYVSAMVMSLHIDAVANALTRRLKSTAGYRKGSMSARLTALYLADWTTEDHELSEAIASHFTTKSARYSLYKVGDRLLRSRVYGKTTETFLKHATLRNFEISTIFRYVDYLTQRYGYNHPELNRISQRFTKRTFRPYLTRAQKVKAATVLLKIKNPQDAAKILSVISKDYLDSGTPPLYVQRNIFKLSAGAGNHTPRGSTEYKRLMAGREYFENLIRQNPTSYCVVGNGPSEIGKSHGSAIDSNNVVIRFNNYDLTRPEDYGSKQTVWVRVPNDETTAEHSFSNDIMVLASNGFEYKRENPDRYLLQSYLMDKQFTSVPVTVFVRLISELGCLPSTGMVMLYWLYTIAGPIPRQNIYGFSHLSEIDDFRSHYFTDNVHRRDHKHAWDREIKIISRIVT